MAEVWAPGPAWGEMVPRARTHWRVRLVWISGDSSGGQVLAMYQEGYAMVVWEERGRANCKEMRLHRVRFLNNERRVSIPPRTRGMGV
jgi:hypothetical protein